MSKVKCSWCGLEDESPHSEVIHRGTLECVDSMACANRINAQMSDDIERLTRERDEWRVRCLGPVDSEEVSEVIAALKNVSHKEVVVKLMRVRDEMRGHAERWLKQRDAAFDREEALTKERDEARKALADLEGDDDAWRRTYETTHAELLQIAKERDEARVLLQAARDFKNGPDWDTHRGHIEAIEKERDEARYHHNACVNEKVRAEKEHHEALAELAEARAALVEIPVARSVAERQREADANAVFSEFNVHDYAERAAKAVRDTPLVTDGGGE